MSLSVEGWVVAEDARGALCLRPILGAMFTPVEMHLNGSTVAVQPRWSAAGDASALLKLRLDQLYTLRTIVVSKSLGVCASVCVCVCVCVSFSLTRLSVCLIVC